MGFGVAQRRLRMRFGGTAIMDFDLDMKAEFKRLRSVCFKKWNNSNKTVSSNRSTRI